MNFQQGKQYEGIVVSKAISNNYVINDAGDKKFHFL